MLSDSYRLDDSPAAADEVARLGARARGGARGFLTRMRKRGLRAEMDVLDLGSGEGTLTLRLATLCRHGSVTGLEAQAALIGPASARAQRAGLANCTFVEGLAEALPFPAASFDAVHARLVFQHLRDPVCALREVRRVLRPRGLVIIEDIDHEMLTLDPPLPGWVETRRQWQEGQRARGGDPQVGRKLAGYLRATGFTAISVAVEGAHGHGDGVQAFATNLGPSLTAYIRDPVAREAGDALMSRLRDPETAATVDLYLLSFVACARTPDAPEAGGKGAMAVPAESADGGSDPPSPAKPSCPGGGS